MLGIKGVRHVVSLTKPFANSVVIDLVNDNFVAIQVDSEDRPDIGERYSDWTWPANAFMNARWHAGTGIRW